MRATFLILVLSIAAGQAIAEEASPLDELNASAGTDAASLIRLGDLYVEAGRLNDAKRVYKRAKWKGDNPEARFGIIRLSMAENKFQTAKHYCRILEQKYPQKSTGDVCSGEFWLGNLRSSRAIESFEKAVAKGDIARGKTGIGEANLRLAKWDDAIAAFKEAIAANAGYLADMGMGLALEKKGDVGGALESLKKAVEKEPASCQAHYHYGRLLGGGEMAVKELQTALSIKPNWYEANLALGQIFEKDGKLKEAGEAYLRATEGDNSRGDADAYFGLAKIRQKEGKLDEAVEALQKVIDKVPNHAEGYLLFAEIYYQKKEPDQAIEALDRAREVASGDIDVFVRSAEIYMELGRYTNARAYLSQAVSMKPKNSKAHKMLGDIACERKQYEEGQRHYQNALKGDMKGVDKKEVEKRLSSCKK